MITFEELMQEHLEWTAKQFPKGTSKGGILHAHRELDEIIQDIENGAPKPIMAKEYADALFCIIDSANREGISIADIVGEGYSKLQINKIRKWKYNGDGSYSHIKQPL